MTRQALPETAPSVMINVMIRAMDELSYLPLAHRPEVSLRTGRLIATGILLLLAASFFALIAIAIPFFTLRTRTHSPQQTNQLMISAAIYLAISAVLGALSFGALMPRRWARPLILILCTHWLIGGIVTIISLAAVVPVLLDGLNASGTTAPPIAATVLAGTVVMLILVGGVVWPLLIILLSKGPDVLRTYEWRDPVPRWTDRCPVNILGLSLTLVVAAVLSLFTVFRPVLPVLGTVLHGHIVIAISIVLAIVFAVAAVQVYRLKAQGWWLGLAAIVLPLLLYAPSGWMISMREYYSAAGVRPDQIAVLLRHETAVRCTMVATPLLFAIAFTIYMLRLRPAFLKPGLSHVKIN